jgi:hypothetical protein
LVKHLHIVCLDVPYPPDYGGVFDLFYKLHHLKSKGVKIHLHCFEYGRGEQAELNQYCESVNYYERKKGHKGFSLKWPYIVSSRASESLIQNLLADNYPVLLEGIHCSYFLQEGRLLGRKVVLRLHNIEYLYYRQLSKNAGSLFKRIYYWNESRLLRRYEKDIAQKADLVLTVSEKDAKIYRAEFGASSIHYLPVFLPWSHAIYKEGLGSFCLYHGNLSVDENEKVAIWLLKNVFKDLGMPFVIAGKNPSNRLQKLVNEISNAVLVSNPSVDEMMDLIAKAQIHVLPSFNNTGMKLKLLNALFCGRHCVVNEEMVVLTGLEQTCHIAGNADGFKSILIQLFHRPFSEDEIQVRKGLLNQHYDNVLNAERLIRWIW